MSVLSLRKVIELLEEYTQKNKSRLEIILIGGLALHFYGLHGRSTIDLDAEVRGEVEPLMKFLKKNKIPADIGESIERWSTINLLPGYRRRALPFYKQKFLVIKVLAPLDFVITKLRRFTEDDLHDALFVADKYRLSSSVMKKAGAKIIKSSPKDTALFAFKKNLDYFLRRLKD